MVKRISAVILALIAVVICLTIVLTSLPANVMTFGIIDFFDAYADLPVYRGEDLNYAESTNTIINPERGFFRLYATETETLKAKYTEEEVDFILTNENFGLHTDDIKEKYGGNTFLLRFLLYNNYDSEHIDNSVIRYLNNYFVRLRKEKLKVIVRFAYVRTRADNTITPATYDGDVIITPGVYGAHEPPTLDMLLGHIEQLRGVFELNQDIISVVQAGFIGSYGEWHTTRFASSADRIAVINKLLDVVPAPIKIQVRRPSFWREVFGNNTPTEQDYLNNAPISRLGLHSDSFLGSETDLGTWPCGDRDAELKWMGNQAKYTLWGGEASAVGLDASDPVFIDNSLPYCNLNNALYEMSKIGSDYLHGDFNDIILRGVWGATIYNNTAYDVYNGLDGYKYIKDHMGYRFVLEESKLPLEICKGDELKMALKIKNTGFGNVVYEKRVQVLLEKDGVFYTANVDVDPRKWYSNVCFNVKDNLNDVYITESHNVKLTFETPTNLTPGDYKVYLRIADRDAILNNAYNIQFANQDGGGVPIYNADLAANYVGSVRINDSTAIGNSDVFKQKNTKLPIIEGTTNIADVKHNPDEKQPYPVE